MNNWNTKIKRPFLLLVSTLIVVLGYFLPTPPDLSYPGKMVLFILVSMVLLWITKPISYSLSTFFMIILLEVFRVVDDFSEAVVGFSSQLMFFIISVFMLGRIVTNIGLHQKIASGILSLAKGSYRRTLWSLSMAIYVLAFFLPSGSARVQVLLPVVEALGKKTGKESNFIKSGMLILALICPIATVGVLTGGGYPMIAAELMKDYGVNFSWLGWILTVSPVVFLTVVLGSYVIIRTYPPKEDDGDSVNLPEFQDKPLTYEQKFFLFIFSLIVGFWIFAPALKLDYAVGTFIGLMVFAVSPRPFIQKNDIKNLGWDEILMLGGALSIGGIVNDTGAADWVVNTLMYPVFHSNLAILPLMGVILLVMLVSRIFFINPSGWLVVLLPLLLGLAVVLNISVTKLGLIITFFSGISLLPLSTPPCLLVFSFNHFSMRDHIICISQITLIAVLLLTLAWFFYWPILGIL